MMSESPGERLAFLQSLPQVASGVFPDEVPWRVRAGVEGGLLHFLLEEPGSGRPDRCHALKPGEGIVVDGTHGVPPGSVVLVGRAEARIEEIRTDFPGGAVEVIVLPPHLEFATNLFLFWVDDGQRLAEGVTLEGWAAGRSVATARWRPTPAWLGDRW